MSIPQTIERRDRLTKSMTHRLIKESNDAIDENKKAVLSLLDLLREADRVIRIPFSARKDK